MAGKKKQWPASGGDPEFAAYIEKVRQEHHERELARPPGDGKPHPIELRSSWKQTEGSQ